MSGHIIHKQKLTINIPGNIPAQGIRERVDHVLRDELPGLIENAFDEIWAGDNIIRIDKLDLDLGLLPVNNLEYEFKTRIVRQIKESLHYLSGSDIADSSLPILQSATIFDILVAFLDTGYFPWYSSIKSRENLEEQITEKFRSQEWSAFCNFLSNDKAGALKRLINQFSDEFVTKFISNNFALLSALWPRILSELISAADNFDEGVSNGLLPRFDWSLADDAQLLEITSNRKLQTKIINDIIDSRLPGDAGHNVYNLEKLLIRELQGRIISNGFIEQFAVNIHEKDLIEPFLRTISRFGALGELSGLLISDGSCIPPEVAYYFDKLCSNSAFLTEFDNLIFDDGIKIIYNKNFNEVWISLKYSNRKYAGLAQANINSIFNTVFRGIVFYAFCVQYRYGNLIIKIIENEALIKAFKEFSAINGIFSREDFGKIKDNPVALHFFHGLLNENGLKEVVEKLKRDDSPKESLRVAFNQLADTLGNIKAKPSHEKISIKPTSAGTEIYVKNCGVVLLNPFLIMYFEELGLYANDGFANAEAHERCVMLLNYLATGNNEAPEFDLYLPKVLCGMPESETLPYSVQLTELEKTESEHLLKSVCNHWPPLNHTSIEGLRTTFLQRAGKLIRKEHGWVLRVEQKTVDILLEQIPWGYSTIKLPWMKEILNVEWC